MCTHFQQASLTNFKLLNNACSTIKRAIRATARDAQRNIFSTNADTNLGVLKRILKDILNTINPTLT